MLRTTRSLLLALLTLALPAAALAQCSTGVTNDTAAGGAVFGLRWDGLRLAAGQSISLDCDSRLLTAAFLLRADPGVHSMGVPYLNMGDTLYVDLVDEAMNVLTVGMGVVEHETDMGWVTAEFAGPGANVPAGTYLLGARIAVDKISTVGTTEDLIDGMRHFYNPGSDWGTGISSGDCNLVATWEEHIVAAERWSLGAVKAGYR
ncbi:MAG TPA: hypothetical protein P5571_10990 [Candidatus Krumholzibacteria bacterium]|nr:hypothetical protein [Candidatus Krumholzibacteria bacterium]HRX51881.1 hypothetical protein [Candidatus Krumholzibacteria bacterium]